jgi:hypothetical protein
VIGKIQGFAWLLCLYNLLKLLYFKIDVIEYRLCFNLRNAVLFLGCSLANRGTRVYKFQGGNYVKNAYGVYKVLLEKKWE